MVVPILLLLFFAPADTSFESAAALVAAGKFPEARQVLSGLKDEEPGVLHLRGLVAYNLKEYAAAVDSLNKAIRTEAPGSKAYQESSLLIGQSLYLQNKAADAIPFLEKARMQPSTKQNEIDYMLGNGYIQAHQPEKAVTAFAAMFQMDPQSASARLLTAQMMVRQEFEEDAIRQLREALRLNPKLPGAHLLLGELATYRSRIDEAVDELKQEVALNPGNAMVYYKLGDAYSRREQWDESIPQLQRSIWLNPAYSGPYILLGKAYLKTQQLPNAEGMLRRALQLDPQNSSAMYLLGQTLIASGRTEQGRQLLQQSQQQRRDATK